MNETSSKRAMASWKWLQRKSHLAAVCLQHPSINKGDPITSWPLFVPCQSIYPEAHHSQQKLESTSQTGADFWFASNMNDKQRWNAEKTTYDNSGSAGLHVLQVPCQSGLETTLPPLQKKECGFSEINSITEKIFAFVNEQQMHLSTRKQQN